MRKPPAECSAGGDGGGFWEGVWTVICHIHDIFIGGELAPVITESTEAIGERSRRNADMNVGFEMLGEKGTDKTWHRRNGKGGGYDKLPNDPL